MRGKAQVEDILEVHSAAVRELAEKLRATIKEIVPEATEKGYPGWHGMGYALEGRLFLRYIAYIPIWANSALSTGHYFLILIMLWSAT